MLKTYSKWGNSKICSNNKCNSSKRRLLRLLRAGLAPGVVARKIRVNSVPSVASHNLRQPVLGIALAVQAIQADSAKNAVRQNRLKVLKPAAVADLHRKGLRLNSALNVEEHFSPR